MTGEIQSQREPLDGAVCCDSYFIFYFGILDPCRCKQTTLREKKKQNEVQMTEEIYRKLIRTLDLIR